MDFSVIKSVFSYVIAIAFLFGAFFVLADSEIKSMLVDIGVRRSMHYTYTEKITQIGRMLVYNEVSPFFVQKEEKKQTPAAHIQSDKDKPKNIPKGEIKLKNETAYEIDVNEVLKEKPFELSGNPKVLIVHTHASESYTPDEKHFYVQEENYRTDDCNYNMIRVGEVLAKTLRDKGIEVVHDKTVNDRPSYNASYAKTKTVVEKHLSRDKDIVFVFDIHRDALGDKDNPAKFVNTVNGTECAQIMMVCGTDTNLENPLWKENLRLALNIQSYMEGMYPGIMRPVNLRKERFNMHLTTGSLIFEIGANGNTLTQALASAEHLGEGLAAFIKDSIK